MKLQNGEYVSLGALENALKGGNIGSNLVVYLKNGADTTVALIEANEKQLRKFAQEKVRAS